MVCQARGLCSSELERGNPLCYGFQTMTRQFFRSSVAAVLSVLFLYAGVAWAMESCLRHDEHAEGLASEAHHDASPSSNHSGTSDHSAPVWHCAPAVDLAGPAALVASIQIPGATKDLPSYSFSPSVADDPHGKSNVWLNAHFKRITTFSHPSDLPYRLFLSILQI